MPSSGPSSTEGSAPATVGPWPGEQPAAAQAAPSKVRITFVPSILCHGVIIKIFPEDNC